MLKVALYLILITVFVQATIVITSPLKTDFPNNEVEYMYANFGEVPYGKTISVDLKVVEQSLCGSADSLEHFTTPTYVVIKISIQQSCSFTKRAINAQAKGAKGILIATKSYDYAQGNVFQGDDGNGKKVHITTLFISNTNYDKLKALNNIQIIAKYPVPKERISTLSIFISSSKRSSYVFLRELQEEYQYLKDYIVIEPIYHTIECESCSSSNCLFSKYCCFDYEDYTYNIGQTILKEEMHQYAIFIQRGPEKWLQYMNLFDQYCMGDWQNVEPCIKKIINMIQINDVRIPNPQQTLIQWKIKETKLGFDTFPEVAINNMIYRGNFEADQIIQAFCQSLQNPPPYCSGQQTEADAPSPTNSHLTTILLATFVSVAVVVVLGICGYRKFIKKELTTDMTSRVGELVANYANKVSKQKIKQREKLMEADVQEL